MGRRAEVDRRSPRRFRSANDERRADRPFEHQANLTAIDPNAKRVLYFPGVQSEASSREPVDAGGEITHAAILQSKNIARTSQLADRSGHVAGDPV